MRIGMILDNECSNDTRVLNEIQALIDVGHEVFVLCVSFGSAKLREELHGAKIFRLPISKKVFNKIRGLNHTLFNIYPLWWSKHIRKFAKQCNIEILHVHDLWMLEGALWANKRIGVRIVADLHENFVYALGNYRYSTTFPGNILISQKKWAKSEVKWLNEVDDIIVVIEEAKERVEQLGIKNKTIAVVPNYVNRADFSLEDERLTPRLRQEYKDHSVLTYVGGFDRHRGIHIVISAIPSIVKKIPNFKFVLVGGGSIEKELKTLAEDKGVSQYVEFRGFRSQVELPSFIAASDVCIIPHLKTQHTDKTIPHKLFQYMFMKKPVVATNCKPIERIVKESKSGKIYTHDSIEECSTAVVDMFNDNLVEYGDRGHEAVMSKYNWKNAAKELLSVYGEQY